jgi:hypothetical protein
LLLILGCCVAWLVASQMQLAAAAHKDAPAPAQRETEMAAAIKLEVAQDQVRAQEASKLRSSIGRSQDASAHAAAQLTSAEQRAGGGGGGGGGGGAKVCDPADSDQHIVFSTGCNAFQHWQAEVLLNSAMHAGQCGSMTRIVVGCDKKVVEVIRTHAGGAADELISNAVLERSTFPGLKVHVAPAIPEAREFPWFNKPWSFHHWLKEKGDSITERAIAILDPDEFFLQPLTQRKGDKSADGFRILNNWPEAMASQVTDVVKPGMAVCQEYGLGTVWLNMFDKTKICPGGASSPCAKMDQRQGMLHYPCGPPYIFENGDFRKVMPTWWELMKPVYAQDKGDIQADMYAYVYAAIHHDVKHVVLQNYMVSNVDVGADGGGEGWPLIDKIQSMSCHNPLLPAGTPRPGFVHAAGHYKACTKGDPIKYEANECPEHEGSVLWNFHKGHVPSTILNCDEPLIMTPPDDLYNVQYTPRGKRSAFLMCNLIFMINRAATDYKKKFCKSGYQLKKCTRIITGNPGPPPPKSPGNPWGYPLAKVVPECMK